MIFVMLQLFLAVAFIFDVVVAVFMTIVAMGFTTTVTLNLLLYVITMVTSVLVS